MISKLRQITFKKNLEQYIVRGFAVCLFLFLWHILVTANISWPLQFGNLPKPSNVLIAWYQNLFIPSYYKDIIFSFLRVFSGIVLGLISGVPLGIWIGLPRTKVSEAIYTNLELFRPIPLIAYLPVAMLLFSTIESSIIFITFIGAFFPIFINTMDAVKRIPSSIINASKCLGCGPIRAIWRIYLPAVSPQIFTGLSIGIGASWMGVITAEMMSGQTGIGYATWQAYHLMDYNYSIIGMFTIGILGFASVLIIRSIERQIIKWQ
ncbi:ABC transporter permease [Metabacillus fastidiosus]|uniref:ABC transporter permease n=1 Tax=Metabacillus fastidiosus TaxID=1458 RepID=UPI002DBC2B90|nr:ABC transporter permease [Metabacillus fastidiosus]MEC2077394.1 ABC transporter permease [Metabacillus fastidiosus]